MRLQGNGKFVSAENAGNNSLVASSDKIDLWETFNIVNLGNSRAAFQAGVNGNFVCAESAGASPLIANRETVGIW